MKVKCRVVVLHQGKMVREELEEEIDGKETIKKFFKRVGKNNTFEKGFIKFILNSRGTALLLNGKRLSPKKDLNIQLKDGDELSLLSPLAGG